MDDVYKIILFSGLVIFVIGIVWILLSYKIKKDHEDELVHETVRSFNIEIKKTILDIMHEGMEMIPEELEKIKETIDKN